MRGKTNKGREKEWEKKGEEKEKGDEEEEKEMKRGDETDKWRKKKKYGGIEDV